MFARDLRSGNANVECSGCFNMRLIGFDWPIGTCVVFSSCFYCQNDDNISIDDVLSDILTLAKRKATDSGEVMLW